VDFILIYLPRVLDMAYRPCRVYSPYRTINGRRSKDPGVKIKFLRKVSEGCIFVAALLVNSNNMIEVVPAYSKISLFIRGPIENL
jgi:hypothetical protein